MKEKIKLTLKIEVSIAALCGDRKFRVSSLDHFNRIKAFSESGQWWTTEINWNH